MTDATVEQRPSSVFTSDGFVRSFLAKAEVTPDAIYARFEGVASSFEEIAQRSAILAARFRALGVERGDRVAVMMHNSIAHATVILALARAGIAWVPVNARQRGDGLRYILSHCDPAAVVCADELHPVIQDAVTGMGDLKTIVSAEPDGRSPRLQGNPDLAPGVLSLQELLVGPASFDGPIPAADETFAIMYTSGTTGRPKGVTVTHAMMSFAAEAVARVASIEDGDVMFVWEPLYHIGGAQVLVLPMIRDVTLTMVDRFSASRFWQQVKASGATHVHYLGGILQILLKQPRQAIERDNEVRVFWGGGCRPEQWRPFEERFGVSIRECYGMTEAASITTGNESGPVGSVGRAMPWFAVSIQDDTGRCLPQGERGEIVVRAVDDGPLFSGYFRDEKATAAALRAGALYTGDAGSLDQDGNLYFFGRMRDSVRSRGENVSAWEVESVAAEHPAIEDCAMIGVAADIGEQDIKLFVKLKPGFALGRHDLASWLAARLAPYQVPKYLARVDGFERTPSERIMKHRLSEAPADEWDEAL